MATPSQSSSVRSRVPAAASLGGSGIDSRHTLTPPEGGTSRTRRWANVATILPPQRNAKNPTPGPSTDSVNAPAREDMSVDSGIAKPARSANGSNAALSDASWNAGNGGSGTRQGTGAPEG